MANVFFLRSLYHIFLASFFVSSPLSFRACLVRLLPGFLSAYSVHFHYLLYIFSSECTRLAFFQQVMTVDLVWPVNLQDFLGKLLMKFCVLQMVTFFILQDSELGLFSSVPDVLKPLKENSCFYISVCPSLLVDDTADQRRRQKTGWRAVWGQPIKQQRLLLKMQKINYNKNVCVFLKTNSRNQTLLARGQK